MAPIRHVAGFAEMQGGDASMPSIFDAAGQLADSTKVAVYMEAASFLAVAGTLVPDVFDGKAWAGTGRRDDRWRVGLEC